MNTKEWDRKDEWRKRGRNFLVTVSRHTVKSLSDSFEGENRWAVYVYVYPKHPHFASFEGSDMWQDAASMMPLHGGPSYLQRHYDEDGTTASIQVGSDYHHLHDDFTFYSTQQEAWRIFMDADDLFNWMESRA